jgi:hypothetical protein
LPRNDADEVSLTLDCDGGLRSLGSGFAPAPSNVLNIPSSVNHLQQTKTRCLEQASIFAGASSAEWTARQQVYAPQMIVEGHRQFEGTRELEAEQTIQDSANRAKMDVAVTGTRFGWGSALQSTHRKLIGSTDKGTAEGPSPGAK